MHIVHIYIYTYGSAFPHHMPFPKGAQTVEVGDFHHSAREVASCPTTHLADAVTGAEAHEAEAKEAKEKATVRSIWD